MDKVRGYEQETEELRAKNELEDQRVSLAQKRAMEKQARQMYGSDWKKVIGGAGKWLLSRRVDKESLHNLHSLGMGGSELRNLNNPAYLKRNRGSDK